MLTHAIKLMYAYVSTNMPRCLKNSYPWCIKLITCNLRKRRKANIYFSVNVQYEKKSCGDVENSYTTKQFILNKIVSAYNNSQDYKLFVYCYLHHSQL